MMRPCLEWQAQGEVFLFIANYHAMTTVSDAAALRQGTLDVALDFLACGLDPEKTAFYRQSDVPEVMELAWFLSVVAPMSLLEKCHSYKDKIAKDIKPTHALFAYPVLMAADILAVNGQVVPVGRDQKQHVEVTRDLAVKFNLAYGETFVMPEPQIRNEVAIVPGIDGEKMSKSYNNTVEIFGDPKAVQKRIMSIKTDSKGLADPKDPDTDNVFALYKLLATDAQCEEMAAKYRAGGFGYGDAKKALAGLVEEHFGPMRAKREELARNLDYVEGVLQRGAERARSVARATLTKARKAVGIE